MGALTISVTRLARKQQGTKKRSLSVSNDCFILRWFTVPCVLIHVLVLVCWSAYQSKIRQPNSCRFAFEAKKKYQKVVGFWSPLSDDAQTKPLQAMILNRY
jgi:hypothetical protein